MSRFDTILFDLDGTLIDTIADLADSTEQMLVECGRGHADGSPVHTYDTYRHFVGNGCLKLVERALGTATSEELQVAYERFMTIYDSHYCDKTAPYESSQPRRKRDSP